MTKPRPPLSIDAAIARIVGQLPGGWPELARIADRAESTVRAWGDQHQPESVPLACAIALDVAYRQAGGGGRPLYDVYRNLLAAAEADAFTDQALSAADTADVAREAGHAVAALAQLIPADADAADEAIALKELEDLAEAVAKPIARLGARRRAAQAQAP